MGNQQTVLTKRSIDTPWGRISYTEPGSGSARSVLEAGAKAIATSSWSVAAAQGYRDGESMPRTRRGDRRAHRGERRCPCHC